MTTEATTNDAAGAAQSQAATTGAEQPQTLLGNAGDQNQQAQQSVLGTAAATEPATTTATQTDPNAWLPEKFRVQEGDQLNFQASAQKLGEAYSSLEKRFGAGEARPATVDDYKFELGDEFAAQFKADPNAAKWLASAHELGLNNKQLNFMINELVAAQPSPAEKATGFTPQQATEELQKSWNEPGTYQRNLIAADTAARTLLKDDYQGFIGKYGNDPVIIKLLATVGSEMGEDGLRLAGVQVGSADTIDEMMASEAYRNTAHPDHKRVSMQVRTFFEKTVGTNPIA